MNKEGKKLSIKYSKTSKTLDFFCLSLSGKSKSFVIEFSETFQPSNFSPNEVTKCRPWQSQILLDE